MNYIMFATFGREKYRYTVTSVLLAADVTKEEHR
jgi:hypothetical protein